MMPGALALFLALISIWYGIFFLPGVSWSFQCRNGFLKVQRDIPGRQRTTDTLTIAPIPEHMKFIWWFRRRGTFPVPQGHPGFNGRVVTITWNQPGWRSEFIIIDILLWPVAPLLLGTGGILVWTSTRAERRRRKGLCPTCRYDLKGLAAGTGCPECGKAVRARSASEKESAKV
jgi:hypothetical protein